MTFGRPVRVMGLVVGLASAFACLSQPKYEGPWAPTGIEVINTSTKAVYADKTRALSALEFASVFLTTEVNARAVLQANGVEPEQTSIEGLKQLNLHAFKGDVAAAGQIVYLPKPKFFRGFDQQAYSIKFTETNLVRIQLHSDAQSVWRLAEVIKALPPQSDGLVASHLTILQGLASDLFRLGNLSGRFSGSEVAVVSFNKEMIDHLSQELPKQVGGARLRTIFLMHEAASFVSTVASAATDASGDTRIGRRVTVTYELNKQPVHGLRLYALPLGMRNNPSEFTVAQITRALEMHAFEQLTSPSSKILPFANYSVIAGPPQISQKFVERVRNDQPALDFQTVAVTRTRKSDIEFVLVARNPKQ